jgi:hypothetical protein
MSYILSSILYEVSYIHKSREVFVDEKLALIYVKFLSFFSSWHLRKNSFQEIRKMVFLFLYFFLAEFERYLNAPFPLFLLKNIKLRQRGGGGMVSKPSK